MEPAWASFQALSRGVTGASAAQWRPRVARRAVGLSGNNSDEDGVEERLPLTPILHRRLVFSRHLCELDCHPAVRSAKGRPYRILQGRNRGAWLPVTWMELLWGELQHWHRLSILTGYSPDIQPVLNVWDP